MTVNHPHSLFRTGTRRYKGRPPSNCKRARAAWDHHLKGGPVVWLQLLDGYWGAMRPNGEIDECENLPFLEDGADGLLAPTEQPGPSNTRDSG